MFYVTAFFKHIYPNGTLIDYDQLTSIENANCVAVDFFTPYLSQYIESIHILLKNTKTLYIYISEPTYEQEFCNFLNTFDLPNVHFYSDCVLNFKLANASFTSIINWFIDPVNYYTKAVWARRQLALLKYNFNKSHTIDILLGTEKPHRNLIAGYYENSPNNEKLIFSYYKTNSSNGIDWGWQVDDITHLHSSESFEIENEKARISAILPSIIYDQSYYSAVCETTAISSYNQYTEKVAKPILAKRPFVAFTGQHYLKNLRTLGFKTFDGVIDESYDSISNLIERFNSAWAQVEWLCQQDPKSIIDQLQPILDYNQNHFLTTDWLADIKQINYS